MKGVDGVKFIVIPLLLALGLIACDSGGDDPISLFGPTPEIRISTNPDVIGPSETTDVTVQVLVNGNPAAGQQVSLVASGGVFVPAGLPLTEALSDPLVALNLTTDELGIVSVGFHTATGEDQPNTSGLAKITASCMGASKTVELRLLITEAPATGGGTEGGTTTGGGT